MHRKEQNQEICVKTKANDQGIETEGKQKHEYKSNYQIMSQLYPSSCITSQLYLILLLLLFEK